MKTSYKFLFILITIFLLACGDKKDEITDSNPEEKIVKSLSQKEIQLNNFNEGNSSFLKKDFANAFFSFKYSCYCGLDCCVGSEINYKLGVCNFYNVKETFFVYSDTDPNYNNYQYSKKFFEKAANDGKHQKLAKYYLGLQHNFGLGCLRDENSALNYFSKSTLEDNGVEDCINIWGKSKIIGADLISPYFYIANIYLGQGNKKEALKNLSSGSGYDQECAFLYGKILIEDNSKNNKLYSKGIDMIKYSYELGNEKAKLYWDENNLDK